MMLPERIVCRDAAALAERAASWCLGAIAARSRAARPVRLALCGGSTPRALYRRLASDDYRDGIDWERLVIYWGDERAVGPEDEASNYRMARETLLDHVPLRPEQIHRIEAERGDAAARYEEKLRAEAQREVAQRGEAQRDAAPLDVALVGMGTDGHTASLFPTTPELDTADWVVETVSPEPPPARISLSLAAINRTPMVMVLVSGDEKAARLAEVWSEIERGEPRLPLSRVQPRGRLVWIVDEAAARRLPH